MRFIISIIASISIIVSCSTTKHGSYALPYLDSRLESKNFVDSLKKKGIDTILRYHKMHGEREYFIFWLDKSELQVRKINSTGIFEIGDWNWNGLYRDKKIFNFYIDHQDKIKKDKLYDSKVIKVDSTKTITVELPSHYPYVDVEITLNSILNTYHLPYGTNSKLDNSIFHLARLIESTIYNIEKSSYWKQAERKIKYYPKNYDPKKEKWQKWKQDKINKGEILDDYYH